MFFMVIPADPNNVVLAAPELDTVTVPVIELLAPWRVYVPLPAPDSVTLLPHDTPPKSRVLLLDDAFVAAIVPLNITVRFVAVAKFHTVPVPVSVIVLPPVTVRVFVLLELIDAIVVLAPMLKVPCVSV
jgi:hypothetical protein